MAAATDLRTRLAAILDLLEDGLVERAQAVRFTLLAALAREHALLIGPPGTAKSELARRIHRAFGEVPYFERLLTRFTVPEELFGPLSIRALEEDRYERQTAGFMPQAAIAFIDEVFKANSAILNALLTLLNEREFDNGPRREPCPLISVIAATNAVPEDEVGEAFFDRFLVRVPVGPVGPDAFTALLVAQHDARGGSVAPLDAGTLEALGSAAAHVAVPADVLTLLADLRAHLAASDAYVSDRRWVKILAFMRTAAAAEGRATLAIWDLWLAPPCAAADARAQAALSEWLAERIGVREAFAPERLARVVAAFEAQAEIERNADDLDYDESGRLRFTQDMQAEVNDAKGAAAAPRMSYRRSRRYGQAHIEARTRQIDALVARIGAYRGELQERRAELAAWRARTLWIAGALPDRADANLAATDQALEGLIGRALQARADFERLPRLASDPGTIPAPVEHEPLPA